MHIHLPKEGFKSFSAFLKELFTITCGVVIALSLEGLHQSLHQRHLLHEARANVQAEIQENRTRLLGTIKEYPEKLRRFKSFIALLNQERAHRGAGDINTQQDIDLSLSLASLYSTSWSTAQSVGAVSLMSYQEVKRYKAIYELQDLLSTVQNKTLDRWILWEGPAGIQNEHSSFKNLSNEDLTRMENAAAEAYAYWVAMATLDKNLVQSYDAFLAAEPKSHS